MSDATMLPTECTGYPTWEQTTEGMSGTRKWLVGYDVINGGALPRVGVSLFGEGLKYKPAGADRMICRRLRFEEAQGAATTASDASYIYVTAEYSTAAWLDGSVKESWDPYVEIREIGGGRTWASDGLWVAQPMTIPVQLAKWKIQQVFGYSQALLEKFLSITSRVNLHRIGAYDAGTLLAECPGIDKYYDHERKIYLARVNVTFIWRSVPWNYEYRTDTGEWDSTVPPLHETFRFEELGLKI